MLLLLLAVAAFACRERVELSVAPGAGGEPNDSRAGAAAGAGALDHGAGTPPATAATPSAPPTSCPGRARAPSCRIEGDSARGTRLVGTLLLSQGALRDGVLELDGSGNIRCAGCDCGPDAGGLLIDCPGVVVSPGLVNLHDHLGYAGTPPLPHPGERYEHRNDWRLGENGHVALAFEGGASALQVLAHELRMVLGGTTSIVGAGGRRGLLRNLELPNRSEGVLAGPIRAETFPLDDARGEVDGSACVFGKHPDSAQTLESSRAYVPHLGEGTNQRAQAELDCALGALDIVGRSTAVVHAMALSREAATELARRAASVVWSPRSNIDLYGRTAPVGLLASSGVHIALGTDWLASGSMNQLRELDCAYRYDQQVLGGYFAPIELWRMVTSNAAWALDLAGRFAELEPGLLGDVALFREQGGGDPYLSVVTAGPADVRLVLRQGSPLYGDAELVESFRGGGECEALDVCGASRRVCVGETGQSLAELRAAGEAVYPLFSCDAPPDEPSCEAAVTRECPAGELECDPPPPPPAYAQLDSDADGVADVADDCPNRADPEQRDADRDGLGDACDPCPKFNPGLTPCPTSVAQLRAPGSRLPAHAPAQLGSVRVTALRLEGSQGFYVEDGDHAPYSGIFVYTGDTAPKVELGELVDLRGYFESYRGSDELVDAEVLARAPGSGDYPPLRVGPSELGDDAPDAAGFASLFVRIENARVEGTNPDTPKDYDETLLAGGLRLDDLLWPELDNQYPVATSFRAVAGIAGFSFEHRKLYPRGPSDLEPAK